MSLGRLLATGKSFVGGRDDTGRYRVDKHFALPKFISPRNPFAPAAAKAEPSSTDDAPCAQADEKAAAVATAKLSPAALEKRAWQMFAGARAGRWLGELGQKLNPWPRLKRRPGPVKSLASGFSKMAVQPELSLDKVQVVRSDLSDADVDVVPMKARSPSSNASAESPGKYKLAESAWDRLTARFFGAGPS
jgi:hypothetical protein